MKKVLILLATIMLINSCSDECQEENGGRFQVVYKQRSCSFFTSFFIILDTETGKKYFYVGGGDHGGLTELKDDAK